MALTNILCACVKKINYSKYSYLLFNLSIPRQINYLLQPTRPLLLSAKLPICKLSRIIKKMLIFLIHQYYRTKAWKQEISMRQMPIRQILPVLFYTICLPGCVPKKVGRRELPPCSAQPTLQCRVFKTSRWLLSEGFVQKCFLMFIIDQKTNIIWWNESKSDVKIPILRG